MYHRPHFDFTTAGLLVLVLAVVALLGSCTTAKQPTTSYTHGTNLTTIRR